MIYAFVVVVGVIGIALNYALNELGDFDISFDFRDKKNET